jgi:hypothetical protein
VRNLIISAAIVVGVTCVVWAMAGLWVLHHTLPQSSMRWPALAAQIELQAPPNDLPISSATAISVVDQNFSHGPNLPRFPVSYGVFSSRKPTWYVQGNVPAQPHGVPAWVVTVAGSPACQIYQRPNGVVPAPSQARQRQCRERFVVSARTGQTLGQFYPPRDVFR